MDGIYEPELDLRGVGFSGAVVTVRGESRDGAVLDGGNARRYALRCTNCQGLVFEDFTVKNYRWLGLGFYSSRRITVRNLVFRHVGLEQIPNEDSGGKAVACDESDDVTVENNTIRDIGFKDTANYVSADTIDFWGCTNSRIAGNDLDDVRGNGILVEDSCGVVIENNTVRHADLAFPDAYAGGVWLDGGKDITLRNNLFEENANGPGIEISDTEVQYPNRSRGYRVENNTSRNNRFGIYLWNFGQCPPPAEAVQMSGNTITGNSRADTLCHLWECGTGQPCVQPEDRHPC